MWREGGGVGSTLEAPLCKPGQPAAPVRTVGLALEHQEVCPPGKSASSVLIYRLNFLGSPVGHGNCDLCGGGPGISIPHHLLK